MSEGLLRRHSKATHASGPLAELLLSPLLALDRYCKKCYDEAWGLRAQGFVLVSGRFWLVQKDPKMFQRGDLADPAPNIQRPGLH